MVSLSNFLIEFQRRFCPEIVVYKLLETLSKKDKGRKENVEQN